MHVTSGVVGAIVVAEAVQHRLRLELVLVCDWEKKEKKKKSAIRNTRRLTDLPESEKKQGKKRQNPWENYLFGFKFWKYNKLKNIFKQSRAVQRNKLTRGRLPPHTKPALITQLLMSSMPHLL